jgi:hypothetical protein
MFYNVICIYLRILEFNTNFIFDNNNTMCVTSEAGTAHPSGTYEVTAGF